LAKDKKRSSNGLIKKLSDTVQNSLDYLYQKTYYSQPNNKQDIENIKSKLDNSIDTIVSVNRNNTGNGTMSTLYSRIQQANMPNLGGSGDEGAKKLEELINDNQVIESGLMGFINNTTTVFDYDNKIDTILKYMPKLQEALDTRKDNVLSADHFSKDFINITSSSINNDDATYNEHIKYIKETYKIQDLVDEIYDKASKYGEAFVYVVPYKKAVVRLLRQKSSIRADLNIKEGTIITESGNIGMDALPNGLTAEDFKSAGYGDIQVEFSNGGITSIIENCVKFEKSVKSLNEMSLNYEGANLSEAFVNEAAENVRDVVKGQFQKTIKDDLSFEGFDDRGQDGLVDKTKKKQNKDDKYINVPGTIIRILERKHVIPIYIDEYCFGYYYIEVEGPYNPVGDYDKMQDPTMSLKGSNSILSTNSMMDQSQKQNNIIRYLSNQISNFIDAKFINTNQDLRQEIYTILKYNQDNNSNKMNKIRVTFIPPDDMEHVYFKMNKDTHRGISDLDKAMFPATLFSSMYITHTIWNMTRAQDKRVYYVNQNVDTNISKTLLNTINQIKKGNFGIRQIENINHILNITGMFNDYIIPRGPGGAPIDFEVMQGQTVEYQTELMTMLEEAAINSCEVPMEMIQMRNSVDYASQLTMSSSKFLRKVYNRQSKFQKPISSIVNKIYNNEFDDNITLTVILPPPMFLNLTNTNQMMTNVNEYSQSVAQLILDPDEEEPIKNEVIREINKFHLGTYLNIPELEDIAHKAKQHMAAESNNEEGEE
jgi:hypothetical protein